VSNFHVEVHSRDQQIEHYICQNCADDKEAITRITEFYTEKGERIGLWADVKNDVRVYYQIFRVVELEIKPVVYISGEYRSSFPI